MRTFCHSISRHSSVETEIYNLTDFFSVLYWKYTVKLFTELLCFFRVLSTPAHEIQSVYPLKKFWTWVLKNPRLITVPAYFQTFLLCNWLQHYSNDLSRGPSKHIAARIFQQCKWPSVAHVACLSTAALKAKIMGRKLQMCVSICLSACVFLRVCTHVQEPYLSLCAGVQDGVQCRSLGRRWITTVLTV